MDTNAPYDSVAVIGYAAFIAEKCKFLRGQKAWHQLLWGQMMVATRIKAELSQIDVFKQTARQLECDEDEARFKEKLGKIAKAKPAAEKLIEK